MLFPVNIPFKFTSTLGNPIDEETETMEFMIPLNSQDARPLYEQIYQYIKNEIRNGNLKPDKRLPSSRELAKNLKVSRSTTQLAYEQLVSEGYLEAVPRKGYFAAELDGLLPPVSGEGRICRPEGKKDLPVLWKVDFSPRGIDLKSFPFSTWRKINRAILKEEEVEIFLKGDPQGDLPLREAIREYLHGARGVNCTADQIIVGAGNEYLLMLLSQLLGNHMGIAMENPTYKQAFRVLSGMGHPVFPVGMDESGLMVSELRNLSVSVAYVMPSHQFPMGIVMPVKRRQELLAWAGETPGRYLIEDDYDSEFRYKGKPIPSLQGSDPYGRVIYLGTFSKSIAPAIRVSYMVLPPGLIAAYRTSCGFYSSTVSRIQQQILYHFMREGYFERHLNKMRRIYRGRHDALLQELKEQRWVTRIYGENAGLHVLAEVAADKSEEEIVRQAAERQVRVYGLGEYSIGPKGDRENPILLLGYARLTEEQIREGIRRLQRVIDG